MAVNYDLVVQKIYSVAQSKKAFALGLNSLRAIDPNVPSLVTAYAQIEPELAELGVTVVYSAEENTLVFFYGARSINDLIPPSLVGARYAQAIAASDIDPSQLVVDYYGDTMTDRRNHAAINYNGMAQAIMPTFRQSKVMYTGSKGYIKIPESNDMLLGASNFTYDVRFNMGAGQVVEGINTLRALPIIDTNNRYGQGFVVEMLLANVNSVKRAWLCFRENEVRQVTAIDADTLFNNSSDGWRRLSIVGKSKQRTIYLNGNMVLNVGVSTTKFRYPLPIFLGTYSVDKQVVYTDDGYPRALPNISNTHSYMYYEWCRLVKAALYNKNFDPEQTF